MFPEQSAGTCAVIARPVYQASLLLSMIKIELYQISLSLGRGRSGYEISICYPKGAHYPSNNALESMALYPRQNSTFCLQHCCFELMLLFTIQYSTSIIQHCAFTNQHPYFKFSVLRLHATFVCVCAICLHRNPTFLFSVFTHQHPYFKFTFRSFKCDIHAFHCYVDVRCVCCGAECDMLAAQCNILVGH